MSKNVSEFVVDRMEAWGVKRIFGYPGDGVAGMDVAVDDADQASAYRALVCLTDAGMSDSASRVGAVIARERARPGIAPG